MTAVAVWAGTLLAFLVTMYRVTRSETWNSETPPIPTPREQAQYCKRKRHLHVVRSGDDHGGDAA